ncbi:complex I 51 kDa subunit family protein [Halarsenatibacter silvermanii]|uniref:NADH-quinone oxidoreductase subunit F n=1 Tax=Halarsenatibacter silvermanii TaxID=321763 RepID=A0A1G9STP6_9FIRM|nr:NADH-ubiquinone oxidoreductase-F iron-sulfur binding region domain-containing protein [Halarsenatibacter silvermanii]SDM38818.1 NADH-quinone oxidoreductase subunit F [Halarsenatibacter silvermanii]
MVQEQKFLKGPRLRDLEEYDFPGLQRAMDIGSEAIIEEISQAGLLGRGGAGFPTGKKWELAYQEEGEFKYVICNADEGEPGTFKDRYLLDERILKVLEGMLIAAYTIDADFGYIYIRGEYFNSINILQETLEEARESGVLGENILGSDFSFDIKLVRGAGCYVCGDETSLLNSLEGMRGGSRTKPPYPISKGLCGCPTLVNNVESLACAAEILNQGSEKFAALGTAESKGTKLVCLSGDVNFSGVYEVEFGSSTLQEIIDDLGGGLKKSQDIKFVIPGGLSTRVLPPERLQCEYSYEGLDEAGSSLGSGGVMVVGSEQNLKDILTRIARFYMDESCGTCFPCREGNHQIYEIVSNSDNGSEDFPEEKLEIIEDLGSTMAAAARCGLGQTARLPTGSIISEFKQELTEEAVYHD